MRHHYTREPTGSHPRYNPRLLEVPKCDQNLWRLYFPNSGNSRAMGELKKFDGIRSRHAQVNVVAAALF